MCKSIGRFPEKPRDAITTVLAGKVHMVCMFSAMDLCSRPPAHHLLGVHGRQKHGVHIASG